jgi:predicted DNA-binding transcriptional regulator AlpA
VSETKAKWLRNRDVAKLLNVTDVTIWRWQRDPRLNFPQPSVIKGIPYTSLEKLEAWITSQVVDLHKPKKKTAA